MRLNFTETHYSLALAYLTAGNRNLPLEEYKLLMRMNRDLASALYQKIK